MMYEAFQLTLNQVSGSIGQDAMSMELLCIIDVSHRIDKNINKIASIAIYFFFPSNDKRHQPLLNTRSLQCFWFFLTWRKFRKLEYTDKTIFTYEKNGLAPFTYIFICGNNFFLQKRNLLTLGPLLQIGRHMSILFTIFLFISRLCIIIPMNP